MSTQAAFDIFLLARDGADIDARAVIDAIEGSGRAFHLRSDPGRYLYRNDDTGVSFHVMVSHEVLARRPQGESDGDDPGEETGETGPFLEEEEPARGDEGEETEDDEAEDEEPFDVVTPPVTLTLPLLAPPFFIAEAIEFGLRVGEAARLVPEAAAIDAPPAEAPPSGRPVEEIVSAWAAASRAALHELDGGSRVTEWSSRKAADWWDYGRGRARLEAELAPAGILVPPLRAAIHEGRVKSLVIWETKQPSVLPRADLVLVRRERGRTGLLRLRRTVEEGIACGERVWDLLAPFSELRTQPVDLLIFREAHKPPSQVAAELEVLRLEPVESVRRTELAGVVVPEARKEE
jgi:hypothetical protein